jgi:hypothetical protein
MTGRTGNCTQTEKKRAGAVKNEDKTAHSGSGAAHGGTEHSLRHEAETHHRQDRRP